MGPAIDAILSRHDYPDAVSKLLGEAMVLAVLLGSSLKFDGKFILQTETDGPVDMLVVDFRTTGDVRAYARFDAARGRRRRGARCDPARRPPRPWHPRHDHRPGRAHEPLPGRRSARRRQPRGGRPHLFPPVRTDPDADPPRRRRDACPRRRRASPRLAGRRPPRPVPARRAGADAPGRPSRRRRARGRRRSRRRPRTMPGSRPRRSSRPSRTTS